MLEKAGRVFSSGKAGRLVRDQNKSDEVIVLEQDNSCPRGNHPLPEDIERYELVPGRIFCPTCGFELELKDTSGLP